MIGATGVGGGKSSQQKHFDLEGVCTLYSRKEHLLPDHNRALGQIGERLNVPVKNVVIWGNHSSSQYPNVNHAVVDGKLVREAVQDDTWFTFLTLANFILVLSKF